jgi:hypothetical protein
MSIAITKVTPSYTVNYDMGWIGFTRCAGPVSDAIAYGEHWQRDGSRPEVTHALVVTGADECVEAQMGQGVIKTTLSKYFNEPTTKIYFRRPFPFTPVLRSFIAANALGAVGFAYNDLLIGEEAAYDSAAGHLLNTWLHDAPHVLLAKLLDKPNEFICSQLASYVLSTLPEFKGRGVLKNPVDTISPQLLFGDDEVFAPFINDCSHEG